MIVPPSPAALSIRKILGAIPPADKAAADRDN